MSMKNVLVVEDDADARHLLSMMLQTLGYNPIEFESGQACLEKAKDLSVSIILLDVMMPGMNGYQLLEHLKKLSNLSKVPVVMVTAKDQDDDIMEGYQHGADYYITKPYTMNQIQYALELYAG